MTGRLRSGSFILALPIASLAAFSGCDQTQPQPEPVTRVTGAATTDLVPGDVAVTCINAATDTIQIVTLRALEAGTDLKFSDNELTAAGFNTGETVDFSILGSVDAATNAFAAGSVVSFTTPVGSGVNSSLDQAFIYQGTLAGDGGAGASLLWGLQFGNGGDWGTIADGGALANNVSLLPPALANANNHFIGNNGNADTLWFYTGPTTGTRAQLKAFILDAANWSGPTATGGIVDGGTVDGGTDGGADAGTLSCPGNFTVLPDPDSGTDAGPATDGGGTDTGGAVGGATGSDGGGTGGMIGTVDGGGTDVPVSDGGATDTGTTTDTGTAPDVHADTVTPTDTGTGTDTGTVVDAGTDVKVDTGTGTDAKVDTGTGSDAKVDTGTGSDASKDAATDTKATGGSSGCGCSTASNRDGIGAGAWMLALAGIVMTARRRRRR